jgi:hypothetical protein
MIRIFNELTVARGLGPKSIGLPLVCAAALAACSNTVPEERKPEQAGKPITSADVLVRTAELYAAAATDDQEAAQRTLEAFGEDMRKSMKLADPSRAVDREGARQAARTVDGVRSVAWLDRENLFVIVATNEARTYSTIDRICIELERLGDTLGVVVNLQSGEARTGDELEILSRNCQLAPGERAMLSRNRQVDVIDPAIRAQHRANQALSQQSDEDLARQRESMKVLEATVPSMDD